MHWSLHNDADRHLKPPLPPGEGARRAGEGLLFCRRSFGNETRDNGGNEIESATASDASPDPHSARGHPLPVGEGLKIVALRCVEINARWERGFYILQPRRARTLHSPLHVNDAVPPAGLTLSSAAPFSLESHLSCRSLTSRDDWRPARDEIKWKAKFQTASDRPAR